VPSVCAYDVPAKNHQRTEIGPLSVRMSPAERQEARRKAGLLMVRESEFARLAMAAYDADGEAETRGTIHVEPVRERPTEGQPTTYGNT